MDIFETHVLLKKELYVCLYITQDTVESLLVL